MLANIGHRGFGIQALENSLSAFRKAIEHNLAMCELDVRLTHDCEVIVFHDATLKRMGGVKAYVDKTDLHQLKQIQIFSTKDKNLAPETIPTLKEVLELCQNKVALNIEIKISKYKPSILVKKVIDLVKEFNMTSQVILSSFNKEVLKQVFREDESIRCGYLVDYPERTKQIFLADYPLYSIHPHYFLVNKRLMKKAKEKNIKVYPWTIKSYRQMEKLFSLGVDGIITDYPLELGKFIKEKEAFL